MFGTSNSKRALWLGLLLFTAAFRALCASPETTSPSIAITLSAPKDTVEAGHAVRVDVAMTNISGTAITLRLTGSPDFLFDVELADGKHAKILKYYWEPTGKRRPKEDVKDIDSDTTHGNFAIATVRLVPLAPKQVVKYDGMVLNTLYDVLTPGQYVIQVGMADPVTHAIVESNKIFVGVK